MKILVSVKAGAKEDSLVKIDSTHYKALIKKRPIKGQANKSLIDLLAFSFNVTKDSIVIRSGQTSKNKIVEIID